MPTLHRRVNRIPPHQDERYFLRLEDILRERERNRSSGHVRRRIYIRNAQPVGVIDDESPQRLDDTFVKSTQRNTPIALQSACLSIFLLLGSISSRRSGSKWGRRRYGVVHCFTRLASSVLASGACALQLPGAACGIHQPEALLPVVPLA